MAEQVQAALTILRRKQVEARTGLSRSTLYARIAQGTFPAPLSLGARAVGGVEGEVLEWLRARLAEREASKGGAGNGAPPAVAAARGRGRIGQQTSRAIVSRHAFGRNRRRLRLSSRSASLKPSCNRRSKSCWRAARHAKSCIVYCTPRRR